MTRALLLVLLATALSAPPQPVTLRYLQPELFAATGALVNALADVDGDGDSDLFVGFNGTPNRLYRNDGGTFVEIGAAAGVADARSTRAGAFGDWDADGDPDLLVGFAPGAGPVLRLYRNDGGRFVDATAVAELRVDSGAVRQPVWVDYDADGDLDLFIAFRDRPNALYRNTNGRLADVASDVGLADPRRTVGAVWSDLDADGDLDVIVGNMDGDANGVFRNDRGRFTDVAADWGLAAGGRALGERTSGTVRPCVADMDGDGRFDVVTANYGPAGLFLQRDSGWVDAGAEWGVAVDGRYDTCAPADVDNDGRLDLYLNGTVTAGRNWPDYLYRNAGARLDNATPDVLTSIPATHGAQWADLNGDGTADLSLAGQGPHAVLANILPDSIARRSLRVRVLDERGRATRAGAEVRVYAAGTRRVLATRLIDAGSGYNSQSDVPVHIGLPTSEPVDVEVTWPAAGRREVTRQLGVRPDGRRVLDVAALPAPLHSPVAEATTGMVVSGSVIASDVGARVLEQGGNAVDAAVATAFALSVVEPTMSGIGGRTQLLIRARDGRFHGIDGGTSIPASYKPGTVPASDTAHGYWTIGVPGTPAALALALERHGTIPLARALQPAIALARDGFVLSAAEAERIAGERGRMTAGARAYFLKADGTPYKAGERFVQADLARTLEAMAAGGVRAFYTGRIAEAMVRDVRKNGGFLELSDLRDYAADEALVVHGSYRGHDLHGTYLPASGVTTIQALHLLENVELTPIAGSPAWAGLLTRALLLAFDDRVKNFGSDEAKAARLVSKDYARERAAPLRESRLPDDHTSGTPDYEPEHTTHLSVADRNGGVVALTQSVGPMMGSRAATPGLGFLYAATMGYLGDVRPGDRPFSSQSPLIVTQNGELRYVLGAAGARRIISAIVAVLSRAIDQQLAFGDAMAAPRLHALPARIDLEKRAEAAWTAGDSAALTGLGFTVRMRGDASYFARIHGIAFDARRRVFTGVADPRWQGAAAAPRR